jgi:hypothetical protein
MGFVSTPVLSFIVVASVFLLDVSVPLGFATPVLYVIPVALVAVFTPPTAFVAVFLTAGLCTLLTFAGLFLSPPGHFDLAVGNRFVALCAVWAIAIITGIRKTQEQDAEYPVSRGKEAGVLKRVTFQKHVRTSPAYGLRALDHTVDPKTWIRLGRASPEQSGLNSIDERFDRQRRTPF